MEQITAPLPVLDNVIGRAEPVEVLRSKPPATLIDPARAWLRLNEIEMPADAPIHGMFKAPARRAIDLLRSRLLRQARRKKFTKIALTSPTASCGTAPLAAQLAISLARQSDLRIMLMEFDMRAPLLARLFGLTDEAPLRPSLTGGRRDFDTSCMRIRHNLALSLATEPFGGAAELLAAKRSRNLIEEVEADFQPDLMIMNLPPVLGRDDVVAAAELYDAALLVVRADHTRTQEADLAERLIAEQKPCLGMILNGCRFNDPCPHK